MTPLARINEILAQHPATEQICGDKHTTVSVQGTEVVVDSTWNKCDGTDRSTVDIGKLNPAGMFSEVLADRGHARLFIPCVGDEKCSGRYTMGAEDSEWQHLRDEAVLVLDCEPDAEHLASLQAAVADWLQAAGSDK